MSQSQSQNQNQNQSQSQSQGQGQKQKQKQKQNPKAKSPKKRRRCYLRPHKRESNKNSAATRAIHRVPRQYQFATFNRTSDRTWQRQSLPLIRRQRMPHRFAR